MEAAVTYARVSTSGQVEHGYSLAEQQQRLAAHCLARGYRLVEHVTDEGVSGRLADRPGLRRLISLAEAGATRRVIAVNLTRVGRENRLIQEALHRIRQHGVAVEFVEHTSGDRPADRLLENVLGGVAEFQWGELREKTMRGKEQKAREKGVMPLGKAPFGYEMISRAQSLVIPEYAGRSGEYLVNEAQAAIVRELFTRYAAGASLYALETWLTEQGVCAGRGGRFTRNRIQELFRNPAYCGRPLYGKVEQRKIEGPDGRVRIINRKRDRSECIELRCHPIVDEALFAAVQAQLDENRTRRAGRPSNRFPLRGCVVCGQCVRDIGGPRGCAGSGPGKGRKGNRYYRCNSIVRRDVTFCGVQHRADILEDLAREALRVAATPGRLAAMERERAKAALKTAGDPQKQARQAEAELAKVEAEEAKLLELALSGFSQSVIDKKLTDLQGRRKQAEDALSGALAAARTLEDPARAAARAEATAARLRENLEETLADPVRFGELCRSVLKITLSQSQDPLIEVRVPVAGEVV